jgi:hypothetical protein
MRDVVLAQALADGSWTCRICGCRGTYSRFAEGDKIVGRHLATHDRVLISTRRRAQGEDGPPALTSYYGRPLTHEEASLDHNRPIPTAGRLARPRPRDNATPLWRRPFPF